VSDDTVAGCFCIAQPNRVNRATYRQPAEVTASEKMKKTGVACRRNPFDTNGLQLL
jgi:hypothetical protein